MKEKLEEHAREVKGEGRAREETEGNKERKEGEGEKNKEGRTTNAKSQEIPLPWLYYCYDHACVF